MSRQTLKLERYLNHSFKEKKIGLSVNWCELELIQTIPNNENTLDSLPYSLQNYSLQDSGAVYLGVSALSPITHHLLNGPTCNFQSSYQKVNLTKLADMFPWLHPLFALCHFSQVTRSQFAVLTKFPKTSTAGTFLKLN